MNLFSLIKEQASILQVAGEYTTLKKAGSYWKGACPFHNEKTASFTVSPHKEIFYCFGCGAGGDVITFITKVEHCSPIEAVQHLAERYNINLPQEGELATAHQQSEERKRHFDVCAAMATWCYEQLLKQGTVRRYLEDRGFSLQTIQHFSIGYCPGGLVPVRNFIRYLQQQGMLLKDALEAHILMEGKAVIHSPFEDRIIFPIRDHLGRTVGFGGRVFRKEDTRPKYYNSKESPFFSKGSLLFGLDSAKKSMQQKGAAILVEGYTDCIALWQHGYDNAVATLGTACTHKHLETVARYAQDLIVMYDGDAAGHKAIVRLVDLCWDLNLELKIVVLPPQEDPASLLAAGGDLQALIDTAYNIFEFFIATEGGGFAQKNLTLQVETTQRFLALIKKVADPLKRELLLQKAATHFGLPLGVLQAELAKGGREAGEAPTPTVRPASHTEGGASPESRLLEGELAGGIEGATRLEKKLFCAILSNIQLAQGGALEHVIAYFSEPLRTILHSISSHTTDHERNDFSSVFDALSETDKQSVSRLVLAPEEDASKENFEYLVLEFSKLHWKTLVKDIKKRVEQARLANDAAQYTKLLAHLAHLQKQLLDKGLL